MFLAITGSSCLIHLPGGVEKSILKYMLGVLRLIFTHRDK